MKTESLTFYCDQPKCKAQHVTPLYDGQTGAYLMLAEEGWKIDRHIGSGWKHYCPEHATRESREVAQP